MLKKSRDFLNILIILLPIIDLLSSLSARFEAGISVGIIVKGFMILYFSIYILFLTNSKYKKLARIILLSNFLFVIMYFLFKADLLATTYLFNEFTYLFKIQFFPILFVGLLCYFDDNNFKNSTTSKVLLTVFGLYIFILSLGLITGTAFNTYLDDSQGYIGWYYSGNEISATLILLLPFIYLLVEKHWLLFLAVSFLSIFIISTIGTKVSLFGTYIVGILILFVGIIRFDKKKIKNLVCPILFICMTYFIMNNGFAVQNMNRIVQNDSNNQVIEDILDEEYLSKDANEFLKITLKLLSGRYEYILNTHQIYSEHFDISTILFGLGFSNTEKINDRNISKLIEIDLLDIFYHTGVVGLCIVLFPYFYSLYFMINVLIKRKKRFNTNILLLGLMILLSGGISCISGHVLLNPAVSLYIILLLILFLDELNAFKRPKIDDKKVQILTLHLGYGGAEKATVDLANMLCERYEVEIISLYKTVDKCPFNISEKVKVSYLTEIKPNREEFKKALKTGKFLKTLKEGLNSLKILYLKEILIRRIVQNSNAGYIISSRLYFTKILSKYGRKEIKKVSIEHNYIIDKKYIKRIKLATNNIDALVFVSKSCKIAFKKYIHNKNILYIPNVVSDEYNALANLNCKNLIYVGRLEEEKGVLDLVDIMDIIIKKDKTVFLNIVGDGSLYDILKSKIEEYNLNSFIKVHGFQDTKYITNLYKESSIFILPSHKESFGIVIIEAMKCGIPVIAFSEASGAKELIVNEENGYLIKNRDMDNIANKILYYFDLDKKTKNKMKKNCLETAQKYSKPNIKKQWFELLENINK